MLIFLTKIGLIPITSMDCCTEYPDSKFQLEAHMLGLQSKIHAYQGAGYEGAILNEAEMLSEQLLVQFPID